MEILQKKQIWKTLRPSISEPYLPIQFSEEKKAAGIGKVVPAA